MPGNWMSAKCDTHNWNERIVLQVVLIYTEKNERWKETEKKRKQIEILTIIHFMSVKMGYGNVFNSSILRLFTKYFF